jgi:RHS repeat-associated protein
MARRLVKRLLDASGAVVSRTRYAWDDETLVHETREERDAGVLAPRWKRTYCFEDNSAVPLAHRTVAAEGDGGRWLHYLTDEVGAPDRLFAADGTIVAELSIDPWGRGLAQGATATPIRFRGQYADDETGLSYNRHRYYDPRVGRYISPDPLGPEGDLNPYCYAGNRPTLFYDELGLMPKTVYTRPDGTELTGSSGGATGPVDPAIRGAVSRAGRTMDAEGESRGTTFGRCAEVDALNKRAAEIRADRNMNPATPRERRNENAAIRNEIRRELSRGGGARMVTRDSQTKERMNPCAKCQQILREMGCHPKNTPRGGQGIMGKGHGDSNVPFSGKKDHVGDSVHTSPATTESYAPTMPNGQQEQSRGGGPRFVPAEPRDLPQDRRNQR